MSSYFHLVLLVWGTRNLHKAISLHWSIDTRWENKQKNSFLAGNRASSSIELVIDNRRNRRLLPLFLELCLIGDMTTAEAIIGNLIWADGLGRVGCSGDTHTGTDKDTLLFRRRWTTYILLSIGSTLVMIILRVVENTDCNNEANSG